MVTGIIKMFTLFDPRISIWRIYPEKLILKEKEVWSAEMFLAAPNIITWNQKQLLLRGWLTCSNTVPVGDGGMFCDAAITREERRKVLWFIVPITTSRHSIQACNGPQGDVRKRKLETNSHKYNNNKKLSFKTIKWKQAVESWYNLCYKWLSVLCPYFIQQIENHCSPIWWQTKEPWHRDKTQWSLSWPPQYLDSCSTQNRSISKEESKDYSENTKMTGADKGGFGGAVIWAKRRTFPRREGLGE